MSLYIATATWDDVPHLTEENKLELMAGIPPYLRDAKIRGIPVLGAGLIYPLPEEEIRAPDTTPILETYPRGFSMDVGWNRTAVGWFAKNPQSGVVYIHDYYYQGERLPLVHADAIKSRGAWIPGVIDPRSDGRSQDDGQRLFETYIKCGLKLTKADNSVTTGITAVWQALATGKLKVFAGVQPFWDEIRMYRRKQDENETGKIVKKNDHFMDLVRYFVMSGIQRMVVGPGQSSVDSGWYEGWFKGGAGRSGWN